MLTSGANNAKAGAMSAGANPEFSGVEYDVISSENNRSLQSRVISSVTDMPRQHLQNSPSSSLLHDDEQREHNRCGDLLILFFFFHHENNLVAQQSRPLHSRHTRLSSRHSCSRFILIEQQQTALHLRQLQICDRLCCLPLC